MNGYRNYRKTAKQPMRPYVVGEDLTGISVNKEDTPEEGGMIAVNPKNPEDRWYVAKQFFLDNYEEADDEDSIDELVAAIDANTLLQWDGRDVALVAAHELATIARKADARAAEWIDRCYQSEERAIKAEAERDALLAERTLVDIVFDGPPSHESGRFVEVEDMSGAGVRVGEWIDRGNGYWALRIPTTTPRG